MMGPNLTAAVRERHHVIRHQHAATPIGKAKEAIVACCQNTGKKQPWSGLAMQISSGHPNIEEMAQNT
jgi:hypothetical protein